MRIEICSVLAIIGLSLCAESQTFSGVPQAVKKTGKPAKAQSSNKGTGNQQGASQGAAKDSSAKILVETYPIAQESAAVSACDGLLPVHENRTLTASEIAGLLGNPSPFSIAARGRRRILVYATHRLSEDRTDADHQLLRYIESKIDELARTGKFDVELRIPHAQALGDVGEVINGLNYGEFTIDPVGPDTIRVSADSVPDCGQWRRFLTNVRSVAWRPFSVQPVDKVFYLDGSSVATALSGGEGGAPDSSGAQKTSVPNITVNAVGSQSSPGGTNAADTSGADSTQGAQEPTMNKGAAKPSKGSSKAAGSASKSTAKNGASGKNVAATDSTGQKDDGSTSADGSKTDSTTGTAKKASTKTASTPSKSAALVSPSDVLIFSEPTPGDDAAVQEKRRIVSMLDLPRPEMIVNVWSVQISAADAQTVARSSRRFREEVSRSNDKLQQAIAKGWEAVKQYYTEDSSRYEDGFYKYIVYRHVGEKRPSASAGPQAGIESFRLNSEDFLNYRIAATLDRETRSQWGVCEGDQYCLGYTDLVHPLKPRLMDLLLALTFAKAPVALKDLGLNAMENVTETPILSGSCQEADHVAYQNGGSESATGPSPAPIALLRSALADFLFHYKMAMQFPHEFSPYDLDLSAQSLNTALSPLIDAFNRDIAVFQSELTDDLIGAGKAPAQAAGNGWTESDQKRTKFENSGTVTVRTVSGKETIVDTATQSYIDVTKAPTIPELLSSISAAEGKVPGVVGNNLSASAAAALVGALNTTQSTEAKLGRGLKIDLMPRSLPGASAAEIDVVMNVDETAEPTLYAAGQSSSSNDNLSRVAKHDTTTKMRVDSLRIFEVSSFSAKLLRSRARFPLLPLPGLEIPYIGTLVGIPRRPAAEYHGSIAVLSAIVVPTAADLAYGTRFESDKIVQAETARSCSVVVGAGLTGCEFRSPRSMSDLGNILPFHRAMVSCFATGRTSAVPTVAGTVITNACANLTLSGTPTEAR